MLRAAGLAVVLVALAPAPAFAAAPLAVPATSVRASEGAGSVRVRVTLSRPPAMRAGVRFRTAPATAGSGDFVARSGTLRWRRRSRRAAIAIRLSPDAADEADEHFTVRLSRPRGVRLGRRSAARVTIVDDDLPRVAVADARVVEPEGAGAAAAHGLTVSLGAPARERATVRYSLTGAGATTTGGDVDLSSGELTFAPGEMTKVIPGNVRGDDLDEGDEQAHLLLSDPVGAALGDPDAFLTIADGPADIPPLVTVADLAVGESGGALLAQVEVSLSAASGRRVTVTYSTSDGTAVSGGGAADYQTAAGALTFQAGETRQAIAIAIRDDPRDEPVQAFGVALAAPDGAALGDAEALVTIADDDPAPTLDIDDVARLESSSAAVFTVSLSEVSERQVGFTVSTVDITAQAAAVCAGTSDYIRLQDLELLIDPMRASSSVDVSVCHDLIDESDETAAVVLSNPVNATIGDGTGTLAILDDD